MFFPEFRSFILRYDGTLFIKKIKGEPKDSACRIMTLHYDYISWNSMRT